MYCNNAHQKACGDMPRTSRSCFMRLSFSAHRRAAMAPGIGTNASIMRPTIACTNSIMKRISRGSPRQRAPLSTGYS